MIEQKTFDPKIHERMFADSLLETSWAQRSRRSFTTLTSFGLQAVIMGLLLLLPLLKTVGLPSTRPISTPVSLGTRGGGQPAPHIRSTGHTVVVQNFDPHSIILPNGKPAAMGPESDVPGPPDGPISGPIGSGPIGDPMGPALPYSGPAPVLPPKPVATVTRIRMSKMLEGNLIRKVQPTYPPMARVAHVQGQVVLAAIISKEGTIENLRALSGHPMLVPAAIDAVSQWRYRPYILNDEPVEVETQITVNFTLGGV